MTHVHFPLVLSATLGLTACAGDGRAPLEVHADDPLEHSAKPPHVVLIVADDLGYADLGCFDGAEGYATPNLDRMADDGMKLTSFYSASPVCSPSRAGLLTGREPLRMGIAYVFFFE